MLIDLIYHIIHTTTLKSKSVVFVASTSVVDFLDATPCLLDVEKFVSVEQMSAEYSIYKLTLCWRAPSPPFRYSAPSQATAPKPSTRSYYAPDNKFGYTYSRPPATYGKKPTYPALLSGARESSRPVHKEPVARSTASASGKTG